MPTGYTADVQDGTVTEFSEFAMQCARAFGALITMRDEPSDAPIPQEFAPSNYNAERLVEAQRDLARLEAMTESEQKAAADAANAAAFKSWDDRESTKAEQRARYEAMIQKVEAWEPPTADHNELKRFMLRQLRESIEFDCGPPYAPRPGLVNAKDWYAGALARANRDIAYHAEQQAEETERARKRTKWVSDLRASLAPKSEAA